MISLMMYVTHEVWTSSRLYLFASVGPTITNTHDHKGGHQFNSISNLAPVCIDGKCLFIHTDTCMSTHKSTKLQAEQENLRYNENRVLHSIVTDPTVPWRGPSATLISSHCLITNLSLSPTHL